MGFSIFCSSGLSLAPCEEGCFDRWRILKSGRRTERWRDSVLARVLVLLAVPGLEDCRKRMRGMCCQCGRCAHATCTQGVLRMTQEYRTLE